MSKIFIVFVSVILFSGCKSDDPKLLTPDVLPTSIKGLLIANEGGFGSSTASLSLYIPDSSKVYSDIFFTANNRALGDVANDITILNNKAFIVVQNSHRIEVISTETYKSVGTLSLPGNTPNKILIVNETKAYVTNLYKGTVTSFNPTTLVVVKDSIPVGLNPQGMVFANGKIYVCNSGYGSDSTVSVIDPATDAVIKTIIVGIEPTDIAVDSDGDIFVRCSGYTDWSNSSKDTPGHIAVLNTSTDSVTSTIPLSLDAFGHPSKMIVTKKGFGFVVVKNGIAKFETTGNSIIEPQYVVKRGYTLAFDDLSEKLYVADAKDFVQNGTIYGYDKNKVLSDSAIVGIIPGSIVFKK